MRDLFLPTFIQPGLLKLFFLLYLLSRVNKRYIQNVNLLYLNEMENRFSALLKLIKQLFSFRSVFDINMEIKVTEP